MPITDPLVLPVDVSITPVEALPSGLRTRLRAQEGDFALTRPRGRSHGKVLSQESALLLQEFRSARRVVDAVLSHAQRLQLDPDTMLLQAWPLLRDCFNARFLVAADAPEAAPILPTRERGDRVGRFEVLRCLKVRDDTELYQARAPDGALAALKLARPGGRTDVTAFLSREAAVLEHLRGSGVPRLLGRGRHRGRPWLAASWCSGVSPDLPVRELRERGTSEARAELLRLAVSITRAYARLHRRGVLHGDVWPGNLLVGRRGEIRLVDFGLARGIAPLRLAGRAGSGGVAAFFPPEYARALLAGRRLPPPDSESEQFSIAALLYQLFSGRTYADFSLDRSEMLEQILTEAPRPFTARQAPPWPEVERILLRALSKQAGDRYPSVSALATALGKVRVPPHPRGASPPARARPIRLLEEFLGSMRIGGAGFPRDAQITARPPTCSLKLGGAGVAYTFYRLACLRDDPELLASADAWLARSEAALDSPLAFADPGSELVPESVGPVSPFHARPGVYLLRALVAQVMATPQPGRLAIERFVAASQTPWATVDLTLGRAGTLLACTLLVEALDGNRDVAGESLRRLGNETLDSLWLEADGYGPVARSERLMDLGIAHGWAGLLYASLRWCGAVRRSHPSRLQQRLRELGACAEPAGRGLVWQRRRPSDAAAIDAGDGITGWCAGPSGFIHLWTLAHHHFRDAEYLRLAEASGWSTWDAPSGVPDLCCGLAGRAYGLLNLYRYAGETEWLVRARTLAQRAARLITRWEGARARPWSLFKGISGVALLLADLERPETSCMPLFEPEGWPEPSER